MNIEQDLKIQQSKLAGWSKNIPAGSKTYSSKVLTVNDLGKLVTIDVNGKAILCSADKTPVGVVSSLIPSCAGVTITSEYIFAAAVNEAFTAGSDVFAGANGLVSATGIVKIGVALSSNLVDDVDGAKLISIKLMGV